MDISDRLEFSVRNSEITTKTSSGAGKQRSSESSLSSGDSGSPELETVSISSKSSTSSNPAPSLRTSLPSSWYTNEKLFALETRAIFSQAWHCVTHSNRFQTIGTYYRYSIGPYPIFLILSKDGVVRGFHNVCRHRGFPVVSKQEGCSSVIGCRYHGWSYNTKGELVKAPSFDNVGPFERETKSLFPVHVHQTEQGLIFVNLSADPNVVSFEVYHRNLTKELSRFDFKDFEFYHSYVKEGNFNWKAFVDGYQECYHCTIAHPALSKAYDVPNSVITNGSDRWCRHFIERRHCFPRSPYEANKRDSGSLCIPSPSGDRDGFFLFMYPSATLNCYSKGWYLIRISPLSAGKTSIECEYYKHKDATTAEMEEFLSFGKQVQKEDFDLCQQLQPNLEIGVYRNGVLHPLREEGVTFYQDIVRSDVFKHYELEEKMNRPIYPVDIRQGDLDAGDVCKEEAICAALDEGGKLSW